MSINVVKSTLNFLSITNLTTQCHSEPAKRFQHQHFAVQYRLQNVVK